MTMERKNMEEKIYVIKNQDSFELEDIFECGQCFRWNKEEDSSYTGVIKNGVINVKKIGNEIIFKGICDKEIKNVVEEYFDLTRDYSKIKKQFGSSPLVVDLVAYPFITKEQYYSSRLDIISEEQFTIFEDDLQDQNSLKRKFQAAFDEKSRFYTAFARNTTLEWFCFLQRVKAFWAAASSVKIPKTVGPLPLIREPAAPADFMSFFS